MKVLVVEDEFLVAEFLKQILTMYDHSVIDVVDNVNEAIDALKFKPEVCFVDIRLAYDNCGIEFGRKLNELKIPFLYLTANNELNTLKEAALTFPHAYLTKPFNENDIVAALEVINQKFYSKTIEINTPNGTVILRLDSILYIKSDNVYVDIFTSDGKKYTERISLLEIQQHLGDSFIRVHRSYLINKNKITSEKANSIFVDEVEIPRSRRYKKSKNYL